MTGLQENKKIQKIWFMEYLATENGDLSQMCLTILQNPFY